MAVRIFKRLEIPPAALYPHPFFLHQMAYLQMQTKGDFCSGPMLVAEPRTHEYSYWTILQQINYGLCYFMRPHTIAAFGCNEKDMSKSHILTRAWLNQNAGHNNAIVTVERVDKSELSQYMTQLNNKSNIHWSAATSAVTLTQTLERTNIPYGGCWETFIELK